MTTSRLCVHGVILRATQVRHPTPTSYLIFRTINLHDHNTDQLQAMTLAPSFHPGCHTLQWEWTRLRWGARERACAYAFAFVHLLRVPRFAALSSAALHMRRADSIVCTHSWHSRTEVAFRLIVPPPRGYGRTRWKSWSS